MILVGLEKDDRRWITGYCIVTEASNFELFPVIFVPESCRPYILWSGCPDKRSISFLIPVKVDGVWIGMNVNDLAMHPIKLC